MRIGHETNSWNDEWHMQKVFEKWCIKNEILYKREVHIKEIGRRADFLLYKSENGLINVELKCDPTKILTEQIADHLCYCRYAFALLPDCSLMPRWFINEITEKGIGLIMYNRNNEVITEALPAFYNKNYNKILHEKYKRYIHGHEKQIDLWKSDNQINNDK